MENITTLTTKGQVTIPKAIRDKLGLKPFDKLRFFIDGEGEVRIRKAYPSLEDVVAGLPAIAVPMDEWDDIIQDDVAQHYIDEQR
jgi:AbrB family looped-hinge helix DNA binding protein